MSEEQSPYEPEPEVEGQYNSADRRHIRKAERKVKADQKQMDDILRSLLAIPNGRAWLAWLLHEVCGLHNPTENAAYDSNALHYREGARRVGSVLQTEALRVARKNYVLLIDEHLEPDLESK